MNRLPLWLSLWMRGVKGAPWSCFFCGSAGPRAFLAWALSGTRKLHRCRPIRSVSITAPLARERVENWLNAAEMGCPDAGPFPEAEMREILALTTPNHRRFEAAPMNVDKRLERIATPTDASLRERNRLMGDVIDFACDHIDNASDAMDFLDAYRMDRHNENPDFVRYQQAQRDGAAAKG